MSRTNLVLRTLAAACSAAIIWLPSNLAADPAKPPTKPPTVSFAEDILPLLNWRCSSCHKPGGKGYEESGLDLTSYAGVMKGTKFGPMVVPGDPQTSNLMLLLDWAGHISPQIRMPHEKTKLSVCDRDAIRTWIREGAKNN